MSNSTFFFLLLVLFIRKGTDERKAVIAKDKHHGIKNRESYENKMDVHKSILQFRCFLLGWLFLLLKENALAMKVCRITGQCNGWEKCWVRRRLGGDMGGTGF